MTGRAERDREYRQQIDVKERARARRQSPEYKEAQRERDRIRRSDTAYLTKQRERYATDAVYREKELARRKLYPRAYVAKLPLERLTRLEAIRAVIEHYCFGKVKVLHREACLHINLGTFYQYVNSADVHLSHETDASINTAVAKWLQARGYLTGAAKEFRDLMDCDAVEARLEAIRA